LAEAQKEREKIVIGNEANPDNEERAFYSTLLYEETLIAKIIGK